MHQIMRLVEKFWICKVQAEDQILSVSNALEDAKDERWNPPDSPSRAFGYQITMGTDTYNEFADVLGCQSDTDLKTFDTAFTEFKSQFSSV